MYPNHCFVAVVSGRLFIGGEYFSWSKICHQKQGGVAFGRRIWKQKHENFFWRPYGHLYENLHLPKFPAIWYKVILGQMGLIMIPTNHVRDKPGWPRLSWDRWDFLYLWIIMPTNHVRDNLGCPSLSWDRLGILYLEKPLLGTDHDC